MSTAHGIKFWLRVFCILLLTACQDNIDELDEELARKNRPAVWNTTTSIVVPENTTEVLKLGTAASDPNGYPLKFSLPIVKDQDGSLFNIDPTTQVLAFHTAPDYETPNDVGKDNVYNITININNTRRDTLVDLTITVTDQPNPENTQPTITPSSILNLAIDENSTGLVTTILATDKEPEQGSLTFTLSGADAAGFSLGKTSGQLTFLTPPDAEKPTDVGGNNTYDLTVTVSDSKLAVDVPFTVTVKNLDEPPVFVSPIVCVDNQKANVCVDENTTSLTIPIATDPERDALTFAVLGGADANAFTLDANTGILRFNTPPNYEKPTDANTEGIYTLSLSAKDQTLTSFEPNFTIHILDVNDAPVITTADSIGVPENTPWVATVQATDEDANASLKFSIPPGAQGGADAAKFVLTENGTLSFVNAPNFEAPTDANTDNIYEVVVVANDGMIDSVSKTLRVTVQNVAPVFDTTTTTTTTAFSIPENTTVVGSFMATDPGGGVTYYRLSGADAALFTYNTGYLRFTNAPDYERSVSAADKNMYAVSVIATDTLGSTTLNLTIEVTDVTAGDFDNTFGPIDTFGPNNRQGYITHNLFTSADWLGSYDLGKSVAWTPDGKLVVAGFSNGGSGGSRYDLAVWRLNADGSLDTDPVSGFGPPPTVGAPRPGFITHHNAARGSGSGNSVALATNSTGNYKIVVAGFSSTLDNGDMAVWRLNADGSLDTNPISGFGPAPAVGADRPGFITHHGAAGGNGDDVGNSIALLPDATGNGNPKIVVVGSSYGGPANGVDLAVWRLNADGSLDTNPISGFGPAPAVGANRPGFMTHHNAAKGNGKDFGNSIALLPDATGGYTITVAGTSIGPDANVEDMAVWQLTAAGALDISFGGGNGFFTDHNAAKGNLRDFGDSIVRLPDARILVAGTSYGGAANGYDLAVWQLTADGVLDASFGGGTGVFTHHASRGDYGGYGIALQPDARIVVAGYKSGLNADLAVWQLNANGTLDNNPATGFGPNHQGYLTHHNAAGGNGGDLGYGIALQPDATGNTRIAVTGYSIGGTTDMAVWVLH